MKKINLILVAAVALIATSCTTYSYTTRSIKINKQNFDATSAFVDIVPDYSRRIMAESGKHKTSSAAQEEARFNAIVENNIDVLVDPIYKVTKSGKKYTAQVVGFAGFYKNNRNFYEDLERLKNVDLKEIEKYLLLKDPSLLPMIKGEPCNGKPREGNVREGDVINIYHNSDAPHHDDKAPAKQQPKAQTQPQPQPNIHTTRGNGLYADTTKIGTLAYGNLIATLKFCRVGRSLAASRYALLHPLTRRPRLHSCAIAIAQNTLGSSLQLQITPHLCTSIQTPCPFSTSYS